jgi:hypothetical protein
MLPINFLFLTVWPVVEMRLRCKSGGRDYPPGVPEEITKVLELDVVSFKDIQAVINENFIITFFYICSCHLYMEVLSCRSGGSFKDLIIFFNHLNFLLV